MLQSLDEYFGTDAPLSNDDKFLRQYVLNKVKPALGVTLQLNNLLPIAYACNSRATLCLVADCQWFACQGTALPLAAHEAGGSEQDTIFWLLRRHVLLECFSCASRCMHSSIGVISCMHGLLPIVV